MSSDSHRLAVLIDGDNAKPAYFGRALAEAARHGKVVIRRIYGGSKNLSTWEECIRRHGIKSIPNRVDGKNVADVILIIHAVEILHSEKMIDGFCIVASDNDFAGLANWLHEKGLFVVGISSSNTEPSDFKNECDVFRHVEKLPPADDPDPAARRRLSEWKEAVREAIHMAKRKDGWALLSDVGNNLKKTVRGQLPPLLRHESVWPCGFLRLI